LEVEGREQTLLTDKLENAFGRRLSGHFPGLHQASSAVHDASEIVDQAANHCARQHAGEQLVNGSALGKEGNKAARSRCEWPTESTARRPPVLTRDDARVTGQLGFYKFQSKRRSRCDISQRSFELNVPFEGVQVTTMLADIGSTIAPVRLCVEENCSGYG
jgi:hypothetical protein